MTLGDQRPVGLNARVPAAMVGLLGRRPSHAGRVHLRADVDRICMPN